MISEGHHKLMQLTATWQPPQLWVGIASLVVSWGCSRFLRDVGVLRFGGATACWRQRRCQVGVVVGSGPLCSWL